MSDERRHDDEIDRLLREALADDLPGEIEDELRRETRRAWRRAASRPRRTWWPIPPGLPAAWKPALPQPALVAAALAMLAAGTVMQASPAPPEVVEPFRGRQASALTSRALGRAAAMECVVELGDHRGRRLGYRIDWRAPDETRVRLDGPEGPSERTLRSLAARESVLMRAAAHDLAPPDPALAPVGTFLSPAALGTRLAAPWRPAPGRVGAAPGTEAFLVGPQPTGLFVVIDGATRLPLRLAAAERDGRTLAADCRWP